MIRIIFVISFGMLSMHFFAADCAIAVDVDCSWGQVKCCYSDPPQDCCCPVPDKPRGVAIIQGPSPEFENLEVQSGFEESEEAMIPGPTLKPDEVRFEFIVARY